METKARQEKLASVLGEDGGLLHIAIHRLREPHAVLCTVKVEL